MTAPAITALRKGSNPHGRRLTLLERIAQFANNNPQATQYSLRAENDAQELLITLETAIDRRLEAPQKLKEGQIYNLQLAKQQYREAIRTGKALTFLNSLEPLKVYGLTLVYPFATTEEFQRDQTLANAIRSVNNGD